MTGARNITQLCFSSNFAGIVANKIEQSFYSVYSYSGIESIERALKHGANKVINMPLNSGYIISPKVAKYQPNSKFL